MRTSFQSLREVRDPEDAGDLRGSEDEYARAAVMFKIFGHFDTKRMLTRSFIEAVALLSAWGRRKSTLTCNATVQGVLEGVKIQHRVI